MMRIAIYQINRDRDTKGVLFLSWDNMTDATGSACAESAIYDKVFEGEVACNTLEDVYRMLNTEFPRGYQGRSLSVSDVVEVLDKDRGESRWYYCDCIGFRQVDFDPTRAKPAAGKHEQKARTVIKTIIRSCEEAEEFDYIVNLCGKSGWKLKERTEIPGEKGGTLLMAKFEKEE